MRTGATLLLILVFGACSAATKTRVVAQAVSSSTPTSPWCVATSREKAIERAMHGEPALGEVGMAKLVNGPELHTLSPGVTLYNGEFDSTALYWAVEITGPKGSVTVEGPGASGPVGWAIYIVDARTDDLDGVEAGPEPRSLAWDALTDHSGACAAP